MIHSWEKPVTLNSIIDFVHWCGLRNKNKYCRLHTYQAGWKVIWQQQCFTRNFQLLRSSKRWRHIQLCYVNRWRGTYRWFRSRTMLFYCNTVYVVTVLNIIIIVTTSFYTYVNKYYCCKGTLRPPWICYSLIISRPSTGVFYSQRPLFLLL